MVPVMPPQSDFSRKPCLAYAPSAVSLSANSAPILGSTARAGIMSNYPRTRGDVPRYTTANVVVTATWTLAIMVAAFSPRL